MKHSEAMKEEAREYIELVKRSRNNGADTQEGARLLDEAAHSRRLAHDALIDEALFEATRPEGISFGKYQYTEAYDALQSED